MSGLERKSIFKNLLFGNRAKSSDLVASLRRYMTESYECDLEGDDELVASSENLIGISLSGKSLQANTQPCLGRCN
jgi:hypothetical protein